MYGTRDGDKIHLLTPNYSMTFREVNNLKSSKKVLKHVNDLPKIGHELLNVTFSPKW